VPLDHMAKKTRRSAAASMTGLDLQSPRDRRLGPGVQFYERPAPERGQDEIDFYSLNVP